MALLMADPRSAAAARKRQTLGAAGRGALCGNADHPSSPGASSRKAGPSRVG